MFSFINRAVKCADAPLPVHRRRRRPAGQTCSCARNLSILWMPLHQKHTKGHICLSSAHMRGGACTRSTAVAPARAAHAPPIPSRARAAYLPAESELNVMSFHRKSLSSHLSDAQEPRNRVTRPHSTLTCPIILMMIMMMMMMMMMMLCLFLRPLHTPLLVRLLARLLEAVQRQSRRADLAPPLPLPSANPMVKIHLQEKSFALKTLQV